MSIPRVKHKYLPPSQRYPILSEHHALNGHLELTSDAEPRMFTVEDLYAKGKGSLSDSMWARPSQNRPTLRPSHYQKNTLHRSTTITSSPVVMENLSPHHDNSLTPSHFSGKSDSPMSAVLTVRASSPVTPAHQTIAPHLQRTMAPSPASCTAIADADAFLHLHDLSSKTAAKGQNPPHLRGKLASNYQNPNYMIQTGTLVDKYLAGQSLVIPRQSRSPDPEDSMQEKLESPADTILNSVNCAPNGQTPPGTYSWSGPSLKIPLVETNIRPANIYVPAAPVVQQKNVTMIDGTLPAASERIPVLMSGDQWFEQKERKFVKRRSQTPSEEVTETRLPVSTGSQCFEPTTVMPSTEYRQEALAEAFPKFADSPSRRGVTKDNVVYSSHPDRNYISSNEHMPKFEKVKAMGMQGDDFNIAAWNNPWHSGHDLSDPSLVKKMILADLCNQVEATPSGSALTHAALAKTTGFEHRERSNSFDDRVSDTGVSIQVKEIVRATQGRDPAEELLDWDNKTWLAPPCDRENARGSFDDKFMPDFIKEWNENQPRGQRPEVDTSSKEFLFGTHAVENHRLLEPIIVPDSLPDYKCSEDNMKRLQQTSQLAATLHSKKAYRRQKVASNIQVANSKRQEELELKGDEPNPFSPSVAMYLRPVMEKDAAAIATIYNYYVNNSVVTEDQEVIQEGDALFLINNAKVEKLPFVVAVRGREPPLTDAQGRCGATAPILPQFESVIGFSFTEMFNFGFSGERAGRSRASANLQLYVHQDYMHRGVGRNLLDRLLHSMSQAYSFKNGARWTNPENDRTYESNNVVKWHQIFFQLPVDPKGDPSQTRVHTFLTKFFFNRVACLSAAARKSIHPGPARFLDLVIYQAEATHDADFDSYI